MLIGANAVSDVSWSRRERIHLTCTTRHIPHHQSISLEVLQCCPPHPHSTNPRVIYQHAIFLGKPALIFEKRTRYVLYNLWCQQESTNHEFYTGRDYVERSNHLSDSLAPRFAMSKPQTRTFLFCMLGICCWNFNAAIEATAFSVSLPVSLSLHQVYKHEHVFKYG
jgi:hypothetical protein